MTDTQREFEKWLTENCFVHEHANGDSEAVISTDDIRAYWQAALAHSQKVAVKVNKIPEHEWNEGSDYPSRDSYADGYANGWNDCVDAITNRKDE